MAKHNGHDGDGNDIGDRQDDFSNFGEDNGDAEHRGGEERNDDSFVHRFGTVDANAIDPTRPGQMYFGNGNFGTGYNIADNAKEHVEVALKVHPPGPPGRVDQTPTSDSHE